YRLPRTRSAGESDNSAPSAGDAHGASRRSGTALPQAIGAGCPEAGRLGGRTLRVRPPGQYRDVEICRTSAGDFRRTPALSRRVCGPRRYEPRWTHAALRTRKSPTELRICRDSAPTRFPTAEAAGALVREDRYSLIASRQSRARSKPNGARSEPG